MQNNNLPSLSPLGSFAVLTHSMYAACQHTFCTHPHKSLLPVVQTDISMSHRDSRRLGTMNIGIPWQHSSYEALSTGGFFRSVTGSKRNRVNRVNLGTLLKLVTRTDFRVSF